MMHLCLASYLAEERSSRERFRCDTAIVPDRVSWPVGEFAFKAELRLGEAADGLEGPRWAVAVHAIKGRTRLDAGRSRLARQNTRPGAVLRASYPAGAHVNGESPVRLWTTMEGRDGVKAQGWSRRDPRGIVKSAGDAGRRLGPAESARMTMEGHRG